MIRGCFKAGDGVRVKLSSGFVTLFICMDVHSNNIVDIAILQQQVIDYRAEEKAQKRLIDNCAWPKS